MVMRAKDIKRRYHSRNLLDSFYGYHLDHLLVFILLLFFLATIFINISHYSKAPHTDTALFLDQARSLLYYGRVQSNVLHPSIPGYCSISPHHIYVSFYYSQFMLFLGPTYESAKIANIFMGLLVILVLSCFALLVDGCGTGMMMLLILLVTPRVWTFFAYPLTGSELVATFEIIILLILLETLNLRIEDNCFVSNFLILSLVLYSILRTRFDYFSIFVPLTLAWHFSFDTRAFNRVKTFIFIFMSYLIFVIFLRLSGIIIFAFIIVAFGVFVTTLGICGMISQKIKLLLPLSLISLFLMLSLMNFHSNVKISEATVKTMSSNLVTNLAQVKIYSLSVFLHRLRIFTEYFVNEII